MATSKARKASGVAGFSLDPLPLTRSPPRVGRLDTLDRCRRECAKLYGDARRGVVDAGDASRMGSLLSLIANLLRDREQEALAAKITHLEGEVAALAAPGSAR